MRGSDPKTMKGGNENLIRVKMVTFCEKREGYPVL